jgi:hypothetical protein
MIQHPFAFFAVGAEVCATADFAFPEIASEPKAPTPATLFRSHAALSLHRLLVSMPAPIGATRRDSCEVSPWSVVSDDVILERRYPKWSIRQLDVVHFFSCLR